MRPSRSTILTFVQPAASKRDANENAMRQPKEKAAPGEWTKHTSKKNGRTYWYNKKTKKSSWTDPNG